MDGDTADLVGLFLQIGIPVLILVATYVIGKVIEERHFRSILEREAQRRDMIVSNVKQLPDGLRATSAFLCAGSVVISSDYFKSFMAKLKNLIGGRLFTFETLLERGRREAVLRMLDEAAQGGAKVVVNVRLETSSIVRAKRGNKQKVTGVEVLAYGTAVVE